MKTLVKTLALVVVLSLSLTFAQGDKLSTYKKSALPSLVKGIESENMGVKKSAIYMAGKYKVAEAVDALSKEIKNTEDANTRVLIALALYQIGTPECMEEINNLAKKDADKNVRRMSMAIMSEYNSTLVGLK